MFIRPFRYQRKGFTQSAKRKRGENMKRKMFFSVLITILIFFVTSICVVAPKAADNLLKDENMSSEHTNKQSLETSTRGKDRAEQRHQMKEEGELGKEDQEEDESDDGDGEKKGKKGKKGKKKDKKAKKKEKGDKNKGDDDSDDDDNGEIKGSDDDNAAADSEDKKGVSSDEESKAKKGKWWEFFKKSEE